MQQNSTGESIDSGDVTIVGGGWSVLNVALDRLCGEVIGVNDSAIRLPHVDHVVSMDRLWVEYRWAQLRAMKKTTWLRQSAVQNVDIAGEGWPGLAVFACDNANTKMSSVAGVLNGTSSGMCAINLAFQMRPRRLFLLGFDMCRDSTGRAYWYEPYPWTAGSGGGTTNGKYATWAKQFNYIAQSFEKLGTEVFNVSPQSKIPNFQKITPAQYMRESK